MSVTLGEYARHQYPGRSTDAWRGVNPPLLRHTVVAHVVGRERTERTIDLLEHSLETDDVAAVLVLGEEPSVLPTSDEDRGGPVDLPELAPAAGRLLRMRARHPRHRRRHGGAAPAVGSRSRG